jgi:uncharacterized protein involved in exopolysaccharide biosynthesis
LSQRPAQQSRRSRTAAAERRRGAPAPGARADVDSSVEVGEAPAVDTSTDDAVGALGPDAVGSEWETGVEDLRPRPARPRGYGPIESVGRRPKAFVVPVVICGLISLVLGLVRPPVFTAEAQLVVGGTVRTFQPAEGQIIALQDLTDIYSRLVGSGRHLQIVSDAIGAEIPPGSLTAAPIPDSTLIRLDATGSSQEEATQRADAAAAGLVELVEALKTESAAANTGVLEDLQARQAELNDATIRSNAAQTAYNASPTEANRAELVAAQALVDRLDLQVSVARDAYLASESARGGGVGFEVFSPAEPWGSDRRDQLLVYVFGGLVFGGVVGLALATLAANRWQVVPEVDRPTDGG